MAYRLKLMLLLSAFTTSAFALLAGTQFELPPMQINAINKQAIEGPIEVTILLSSTFGMSNKTLTSFKLDNKGVASLESKKVDSFAWLGFQFTWKPTNLAPRSMLYEIRANKDKKKNGVYSIKWRGDRSYYLIDGEEFGDCDNLFEWAYKDGIFNVNFTVPSTYLECRDAGSDLNNVNMVGQREINKGKLNYYKFDDDTRMGQQFASELGASGENPQLKDPFVTQYVVNLVNRIGKASDMPNLQIKAQVIDADVLNAFAVPGGFIWVYRGLIENTESEAELAGVIAHEIAHVTSRHGTEGMTSAVNKVTFGTLAGQAVSETTDKQWLKELIQVGALAGTNFWVIGGTRKSEAEADKLGAQYAYRAGYDPMGMATLFARWSANKGPSSRLEQYFSDHPSDDARVKAVSNEVSYFLPPKSGLTVSSEDYKKVKARLKQLPRPKQSGQVAAQKLFSSFSSINQKLITSEVESFLLSGQKAQPESKDP